MNEPNSYEHRTVIKEGMVAITENILGLSQRKHSMDCIKGEMWNEIKTCKTTKQKIKSADVKQDPPAGRIF
jgi:hypothetical protein